MHIEAVRDTEMSLQIDVKLVNSPKASTAPEKFIYIFMDNNHLHYCQFPTTYRVVKWLKHMTWKSTLEGHPFIIFAPFKVFHIS